MSSSSESDVKDMVPFFGPLCIITSCYCPEDTSKIAGGYASYELACLEFECACCKIPTGLKTDREDLCFCQELSCLLIQPRTCLSGESTCCCLDARCGFPCNDEIPCILNLCGLTCMLNYEANGACCAKIGDLLPKLAEKIAVGNSARAQAYAAQPTYQQRVVVVQQQAPPPPVVIVQQQQPQTVYIQQPQQQVYIQQPQQPMYVQQPPQPMYVQQQPQPMYVQQPPQPMYIQQPQPMYAQQPQPLYVQQQPQYVVQQNTY